MHDKRDTEEKEVEGKKKKILQTIKKQIIEKSMNVIDFSRSRRYGRYHYS